MGRMIVVKEENLLRWKLDHIVKMHLGEVSIRTSIGTFAKSVAKICLLLVEDLMPSHEHPE